MDSTVLSMSSTLLASGITIAVAVVSLILWERKRQTEARKRQTDANARAKEVQGGDTDVSSTRERLKEELKTLLLKHNGNTKNQEIVEVVEQLATMNPITKDCSKSMFFPGEFLTLTSPPFIGKIENESGLAQFTLGRMSFNIFQPNNLICTVKSIRNPVSVDESQNRDPTSGTTFKYDVCVDLIIHTSSEKDSNNDHYEDLEAIMINTGFCRPSPDVDNRMLVTFTGCSLIPKKKNDKATEALWIKKFANAYKKADEERSYMDWALRYGLQWFLGLEYPDDSEKNKFSFEMKKPVSAHLDVLYLDEDVRITKGNRGTIVVVDRMKESENVSATASSFFKRDQMSLRGKNSETHVPYVKSGKAQNAY